MMSRGAIAGSIVLLAVTGLSGLTSCGLPADQSVEPIDVLFDLDQTTTTFATTTTSLPAPTTTEPDATEPTTTIVSTATVPVYFVIGFADLVPQLVQLPTPVQPLQVLARLQEGPVPGPESVGLRTLVPPGLVRDISIERGVATIDLNGDVLDELSNFEGRTAIGQIVLSMRLPGIGQVRFTTDGVPEQIPVPSRNNQLSDRGEELAFEDFEPLLVDGNEPPVTASATTLPPEPGPSDTAEPTGTAPGSDDDQ